MFSTWYRCRRAASNWAGENICCLGVYVFVYVCGRANIYQCVWLNVGHVSSILSLSECYLQESIKPNKVWVPQPWPPTLGVHLKTTTVYVWLCCCMSIGIKISNEAQLEVSWLTNSSSDKREGNFTVNFDLWAFPIPTRWRKIRFFTAHLILSFQLPSAGIEQWKAPINEWESDILCLFRCSDSPTEETCSVEARRKSL